MFTNIGTAKGTTLKIASIPDMKSHKSPMYNSVSISLSFEMFNSLQMGSEE